MLICNQNILKKLEKPKGNCDVVLDTDTFNEIDDQFALAYLIKNENTLRLKAIYAAPFYNDKSRNPKDGMEKSYDEIMNILDLMKRNDLKEIVYKGSENYLQDEKTPQISESSRNLAEIAMEYTDEKPLYVIAIGAITNVASAILIKPEIIDKIVVVWLGGHSFDWHNNKEFNLFQDIAAARVIFGCGVPLVQLPCMGVVSGFSTSSYELKHWLLGKNELCDYLYKATVDEAEIYAKNKSWTRAIWDVTAVAWLLDEKFMLERFEPSPIPQYDHHYSYDRTRHLIKYVYHINRDELFYDLFSKLAEN